MNQIYKRAAFILAVPDLHLEYLKKNSANRLALELVRKHKQTIYEEIHRINNSLIKKFKNKILKQNEELETAYQYLAYLIEDWSNRAWVISEYQIAKEKQYLYNTPLKYIFISLLDPFDETNYYSSSIPITFIFSYFFYTADENRPIVIGDNYNMKIYLDVYCSRKFIHLLDSRFGERNYLEMVLNSNTTSNEDRFNAILPSWKRYRHHIKNKNTIAEWKITDMTSVRLKLYEIMDDNDLWNKARLLKACSKFSGLPIYPTFAIQYNSEYFYLKEIDDEVLFLNIKLI